MWNGFIGQRIAATARTLHRVGFGLLIGALALAAFEARTFVNVMQGPVQLNESQLASITDPSYMWRDYATVEGRKTINTGVTAIEETTQNGGTPSRRTTGQFMAMAVGEHILIVKTSGGEFAPKYTGGIVALPGDVRKTIFSDPEDKEIEAATVPAMLDATGDYGETLVLAYIGIGALVFLGIWALVTARRREENPERHPICKTLSAYGPIYSIVPEIDAEIAAGNAILGGFVFTTNWIVSVVLTKSTVMRRDEVVWVYQKKTKHSVNFIPTGTTYAAVFRDSRGRRVEISGSEQQVSGLLSGWAEQTPWIIFGYNKKLEKAYSKERTAFVQVVAERKSASMQ